MECLGVSGNCAGILPEVQRKIEVIFERMLKDLCGNCAAIMKNLCRNAEVFVCMLMGC